MVTSVLRDKTKQKCLNYLEMYYLGLLWIYKAVVSGLNLIEEPTRIKRKQILALKEINPLPNLKF